MSMHYHATMKTTNQLRREKLAALLRPKVEAKKKMSVGCCALLLPSGARVNSFN